MLHFLIGMDNLTTRLADYKQKGCEFARWRCVFRIGSNTPSHRAIISNADELARFASICQSQRILPLIEPEVLANILCITILNNECSDQYNFIENSFVWNRFLGPVM